MHQPVKSFQPIPEHYSYSAAGLRHSGQRDRWIQLESTKSELKAAFVLIATYHARRLKNVSRGIVADLVHK